MKSQLVFVSLAVALAGCATAPKGPPPGMPQRPPPVRLFISPAGEPFRPQAGGPPPIERWRKAVDADGDGAITREELARDFDRFFVLLDLDKDGFIAGSEITRYEREIAPEILGAGAPGGGPNGPMGGNMGEGASQFGLLNDPQPVMSADYDLSHRVSREEFARKSGAVFARLDRNGDGKLTPDELEMPKFAPGRGGRPGGDRPGGSRSGGGPGGGRGGPPGGGMGGGGMGGMGGGF